MKPSLLLVDDEPAILASFTKYLAKAGFLVTTAADLHHAREALQREPADAAILDLGLPDGSGLDYISELRETSPDMAIVVVTGIGDIPTAVEAMRRGADNFLTKPVHMPDLEVFLRKSLEIETLRRSRTAHKRLASGAVEVFFGTDPAMLRVKEMAALASVKEVPVLITGETGTGKGLLARWVHYQSARRGAPFVQVNCSSLRGDLLASELFGHARGAFTSAVDARPGLLDVADGATLFLDEIGDMDLPIQSQFLKVLEEKRYRRLGETTERRSDFRVLCATNRDIEESIHAGTFRRDLFFRINVFPIAVPPLRHRRADVPALCEHVLQSLGAAGRTIAPEAMDLLTSYPWPGNVREVRNVLERGLILAGEDPLNLGHFPGIDARGGAVLVPTSSTAPPSKNTQDIRAALRETQGDVARAAGLLGISRATLYRRLKGLDEQ